MEFWNIVLLAVNLALVLTISIRVRKMSEITRQQETIRSGMEELVRENSRIAEVVLDQLENRLAEARTVIEQLDQWKNKKVDVPAVSSEPGRDSMQFNEESYISLLGRSNSKIIYLKQMGMSVQEIAEKLNISQGEIDLKINLQEKQNPLKQKQPKKQNT